MIEVKIDDFSIPRKLLSQQTIVVTLHHAISFLRANNFDAAVDSTLTLLTFSLLLFLYFPKNKPKDI